MKTQICPINTLTAVQLKQIVSDIRVGAVVALATDTVYGLAADVYNEEALTRIYMLKRRPTSMPFQILIDSVETVKPLVQWNKYAEDLAKRYWPGGLTMILSPSDKGKKLCRGFEGLGVRVPNHKGLLKLLFKYQQPLACTSANLHAHAVITTEEELISVFQNKVEYILTDGNLSPLASSVVDLIAEPKLLREGAVYRADLEKILQMPLK